ncbi:MAG: NUDIX hydrolase [Acidimicrobiia bacterium]|nr:NUDIX hydrolase [Acidimicrobiia bacterium]
MGAEADRYVPPVGSDGLRHWQVAGGVIVEDDHILLVKNLRRGGAVDWSTPGGVVDPGESSLEGLTREVEEETGLFVERWAGPLYRVEVTAPDAGFLLRVEAHLALEVLGHVVVDDPDGIVVGADFVAKAHVGARLGQAHPWVSEPLLAHLDEGVSDGRVFRYRMTGASGDERQIERL